MEIIGDVPHNDRVPSIVATSEPSNYIGILNQRSAGWGTWSDEMVPPQMDFSRAQRRRGRRRTTDLREDVDQLSLPLIAPLRAEYNAYAFFPRVPPTGHGQ